MFKKKKKFEIINEEFFNEYETTHAPQSQIRQEEFLGSFVTDKMFRITGLAVLAGLSLLLGKAIFLQVIQGEKYYAKAESNRARIAYIKSSRGLIYDSQHRPLVSNKPIFDLAIVPGSLPLQPEEREERLHFLADTLGLVYDDLIDTLDAYPPHLKQPITVKEGLSYEEALTYKISYPDLPGLQVETRTLREYAYPDSFSHLLGYVGRINQDELDAHADSDYLLNDYIGKSGLELTYEKLLRGEYGVRETEVDVAGREKNVLYEKDAVGGKSLRLSIDSELQNKVYEITESVLKRYGKSRASVILSDPNTGAILSMASYPEYNNNLFAQGISQEEYGAYIEDDDTPLFNRTIKGEYPSGSTIKLLVGAGALEENIITDKTGYNSTGGLWVADRWWFPDWKAGGHGYTTIYKAIADSVNTFFYIIGGGYEDYHGLGLDTMNEYLRLFGLGSKTGIDLAGERSGLVPTREWKWNTKEEEWYIGDTYHVAIGQGDILVTPLQVNAYTSVFANGGTLYRPHIVQAIEDKDGEDMVAPERIRDNFIDEYNINVIRSGMRRAVTDGSAKLLSTLPVSSAGKTGTAQFASNKPPHAWYTGFAPYENPEVVITVLIEEGEEGSRTAAALASEILYYYFVDYQMPVTAQDAPAIDTADVNL